MQSGYSFNVSLRGQHLFATETHSASNAFEARKIGEILGDKFPVSEGYQISCLHWTVSGTAFDWTDREPSDQEKALANLIEKGGSTRH